MIQRKSDTPTDPVTANMPEGVEKTDLGQFRADAIY